MPLPGVLVIPVIHQIRREGLDLRGALARADRWAVIDGAGGRGRGTQRVVGRLSGLEIIEPDDRPIILRLFLGQHAGNAIDVALLLVRRRVKIVEFP
jgi:hypothetical protein